MMAFKPIREAMIAEDHVGVLAAAIHLMTDARVQTWPTI
jgi:hypothetical protein